MHVFRIFEMEKDLFDQQLEDDTKSFLASIKKDKEKKMLESCLNKIIDVIERQYKNYFGTNVLEIQQGETASAKVHSMDAEAVMDMFSAAKDRSPAAAMDFISAKISGKNSTIDYLNKMTQPEQEKLISFAIKNSRQEQK
jgi:hypothetical protein